MLYGLKFIPGMHLRVTDEIEEIGLDYGKNCSVTVSTEAFANRVQQRLDQFDDETVGEWGMFDTQEGHARRASNAEPIIHGIPAANSASGTQTPTDVEQVKAQAEAKRE